MSLNLFAGWWIGGTLGGATANFDSSQSNATIDSSGVLGGITGGWNWQNGPIVISFEGDALGAGSAAADASTTAPMSPIPTSTPWPICACAPA
jgi:hypothetical protein